MNWFQKKIIYVLLSEVLLYLVLNLAVFFISIPLAFDLSGFDTAYLQYLLIFLIVMIGDFIIALTLFDNPGIIFIIHLIQLLLLGFIGYIIGLIEGYLQYQPEYSPYLFLPKLGLILLVEFGPQQFFLIVLGLNTIIKILFIKNKKEEQYLLYEII